MTTTTARTPVGRWRRATFSTRDPMVQLASAAAQIAESATALDVVGWWQVDWAKRCIVAISALELADPPDGQGEAIPQWHVSVSVDGQRPTDTQLAGVARAFGLVGAEEDNHHPGNARHLWLPVDPARRVDCECKVEEVVHVEPDGYKWTNPVEAVADPSVCRGCELRRLLGARAQPCPLHEASADG